MCFGLLSLVMVFNTCYAYSSFFFAACFPNAIVFKMVIVIGPLIFCWYHVRFASCAVGWRALEKRFGGYDKIDLNK